MSDRHDVTGSYPEPLINHILHQYDSLDDNQKLNYLKNNREFEKLNFINSDKRFASGVTIDINAGELLGLSLVTLYLNESGIQGDNTYQVITSVADQDKKRKEFLLSDGAVYEDQTGKKMTFQTTMAQGLVPEKILKASDIADVVNRKVAERSRYPEKCGLIVNVFSKYHIFTPAQIKTSINLEAYDRVFLVLYHLPELDNATVIPLTNPQLPDFPVQLIRHKLDSEWKLNKP
jgi:hypothetical protein